MTHKDALKELAVERYLLGELHGEARDRFEAHLFDCTACASDVNDGALFLEVAGPELRQLAAEASQTRRSVWPWQGWVLGPALAACLTVIVYQSAVLMPGMRAELAESRTPAVLTPLVLANAGARGGTVAAIVSPRHGAYLLSVDIPPATAASAYRCSLYSPQGELVWYVDVSPQQTRDAVTIEVPASTAREGVNELRVQGLLSGDTLVDVAQYRYQFTFAK